MKKNIISLLFTILSSTCIFAELPKVENNAESVISTFQSLADAVFEIGSPSLNTQYWESKETELQLLSDQMNLTYETVRRYVADIERGMNRVEASGNLSKTELAEFKKSMKSNFAIQYKSIDGYNLPENMKPVYDNPNIAILENNAKIHAENIAQAQKILDEMQSSAEIQEIIKKEHEELEQLKQAKKKDKTRIAQLENHAVELGTAYGQAYSTEQRCKDIIASNTRSLNEIPAQIQKYKDKTDSEYKKEFVNQLSDIHTWIDFFDGKNTSIYDLLKIIDSKAAMQKKLDDVVPQKDARTYQLRLNEFLESWKL